MNDAENTLYKAIGTIIKKQRLAINKPFTIFCYENDIPTTTLGCVENAERKVHFSAILKIAEALGLSYEDFIHLLVKELPKNFTLNKIDWIFFFLQQNLYAAHIYHQ